MVDLRSNTNRLNVSRPFYMQLPGPVLQMTTLKMNGQLKLQVAQRDTFVNSLRMVGDQLFVTSKEYFLYFTLSCKHVSVNV